MLSGLIVSNVTRWTKRIVLGDRGGRILVVDGHRYHKHRQNNNSISWHCWRKECRARVKTNNFPLHDVNANIRVVLAPDHQGHSPDDSMVDRATFREIMRAQVIEDPARPVKHIYDAAVSNVHREGGGDRPEIDTFHTFRTMLNRTKTSLLPRIPNTVDDVVIDGRWAETWLNDQYLLYTDNNWGISIFGTNENMIALQKCHELYTDATFRCCPAPYAQFFYNHGQVPRMGYTTSIFTRATVVRARFLAVPFSDGSYLAHVNGAYLRHVKFCIVKGPPLFIVSPISQRGPLPRLVQSP